MRRFLLYGLTLFLLVTHWSCGSTQRTAEQEKLASEVRKALEQSSFRFEATYAYPTGYRPIYLTSDYDVMVSPDTVKVYLPFYGRAYHAPMDPGEGGFHFTSTDFSYRYAPGNSKGCWVAHITIFDLDRPLTFSFDIWENGSARLIVNDFNRQAISFQGDLRFRDESGD